MKKIFLVLLAFYCGFSYSQNPNELSRCIAAYSKAAIIVGNSGNLQQQKNFENASQSFLEAGSKAFGANTINSFVTRNKPSIQSMDTNETIKLIQDCNTNGMSYVGQSNVNSTNRATTTTPQPAAERTFCAMSSDGNVLRCGLSADNCQRVVSGLPGMMCR